MTDTNDPTPAPEPSSASAPPPFATPAPDFAAAPAPAPEPTAAPVPAAAPAAPVAYAPAASGPVASGPIGKIRGTGTSILLMIVTLGIYSIFWYYGTAKEMKEHSGQGIGGGLALILGLFVSIVMVFVAPNEVGGLYERAGKPKPVSAVTGLWVLLPFVGSIVWFVKTNGALNDYWRSLGAQG